MSEPILEWTPDIGWYTWLSEGNKQIFLRELERWKATAELDEMWRRNPMLKSAMDSRRKAYGKFLDEPVPGMGEPYPATEPDEDAAYEYAREQALEDAR